MKLKGGEYIHSLSKTAEKVISGSILFEELELYKNKISVGSTLEWHESGDKYGVDYKGKVIGKYASFVLVDVGLYHRTVSYVDLILQGVKNGKC